MACSPFAKLFRSWKRLQVSYYGGKYSVERMLALHDYSNRNSFGHVVLVCLTTPLPLTLLILLQELVPLQDPREGWRANYGFWIRTGILAFVVGHTVPQQATYLIDGVAISERRLVLLSACSSLAFVACTIPVVSHWMFPVPFCVLTMAPAFYVVLAVCFRIVVGKRVLYQILRQPRQFTRYLIFVCGQTTLAVVYPAYEALFRQAEGSRYQLAVILLLPVLKVAVRNVMLQCTADMEDMTPEAVIFTVDFFNAIYIATCMQSAASTTAVTAITVTDLAQTITMVYGLHRRTATILSKLRHSVDSTNCNDSILTMLNALCRDPQRYERQIRSNIAIRSCLPHTLSPADQMLLDILASVSIQNQQRRLIPCTSAGRLSLQSVPRKGNNDNQIHPITPNSTKSTRLSRTKAKRCPPRILRDSLEILFTLECLVVTAYVEALIPFFYSLFVVVMVHLPNARYHTELKGVTPQNVNGTVFPVLFFGLLQVVSFVLLIIVIKRNCSMWTIRQLSFVLETQMPLIQGKLLLWMVITVCFRVVHFGVDFTFRFKY